MGCVIRIRSALTRILLLAVGFAGIAPNFLSQGAVTQSVRAGEAAPPQQPTDSNSARFAGRSASEWLAWFKDVEFASAAAHNAAPELAQLALDRSAPAPLRKLAVLSLGRIDSAADESIAVFDQLLSETTRTGDAESPRSWAIKGIALLGPPARELTPEVVDILKADETAPIDRLLALEALARIGPTHPRTLPAIVAVLDDRTAADAAGDDMLTDEELHRRMRAGAAEVLVLFGASATPAIPSLLRAARDDDEPLRRAAVASLGATGSPLVQDPLLDLLLFDESPAVQDTAAAALAQLGADSVDIFVELLADQDSDTHIRAVDGLRRIGPPARSSAAVLEEIVTSPVEDGTAAHRRRRSPLGDHAGDRPGTGDSPRAAGRTKPPGPHPRTPADS